jgi:hypothetical protein
MKRSIKRVFQGSGLMAYAVAMGMAVMVFSGGELLMTCREASAQNLPVHLEALRGKTWIGKECCNWEFTFSHKSGPFFSAQWRNPNGQSLSDNNITINILDDKVEIIRGGGSSMGGCTYQGKIYVGHADGQYWCAGKYAGTWGATIRP